MNDENIEDEVTTMTKTLHDPEVERKAKTEVAINFLKLGVDAETVAKGTQLPIEKIIELKKKYNI